MTISIACFVGPESNHGQGQFKDLTFIEEVGGVCWYIREADFCLKFKLY